MSDIRDFQFPPPDSAENFERLCLDLWAKLYEDMNAQRVGVSGSKQDGLDIFLENKSTSTWVGIQCRKKQYEPGKNPLTKKEIAKTIQEVQKGQFKNISELIIATTERRNEQFQAWRAEFTDANRQNNSFDVVIMAWEDIKDRLKAYDDLTADYLKLPFRKVEIPSNYDPVAWDLKGQYKGRLTEIRALIQSRKSKTAVTHAKKLKEEIWEQSDSDTRFSLLTLMGKAHSQLQEHEVALRCNVEALQYKQGDEQTLLQIAYGYLFAGDEEKAESYVSEVITKNPLNSAAWSINTHLCESVDEMYPKIPEACQQSLEVAFVLAQRYSNIGETAKSDRWFKIAHDLNEKNAPEIPATWGGVILDRVTKGLIGSMGDVPAPETSQKLEQAKALLETAWDYIKDTELSTFHTDILEDLVRAQLFLGDTHAAQQSLNQALQLSKTSGLLLNSASIFFVENKPLEALRTLQEAEKIQGLQSEDKTRILFLKANVLTHLSRGEEAIAVFEETLKGAMTESLKQQVQSLFIDALKQFKSKEYAQNKAKQFLADDPENVAVISKLATILGELGHKNEALEVLNMALSSTSKNSLSAPERFALAEACYSLEKFHEASDHYKQLVTEPYCLNEYSKQLTRSLFRSEKYEEALEWCQRLRYLNKFPLQDITRMEIHILSAIINDTEQSFTLSREYLQTFPDEIDMQLFYLDMCITQKKNLGDVDHFLNLNHGTSQWTLECFHRVADLMFRRGFNKKGADILYESRRRFFNDEEAHARYVGMYVNSNGIQLNAFSPKKAEKDSAVYFEKLNQGERCYIIEDRSDADMNRGELSINDPLAEKLIGKKTGDTVLLANHGFHKDTITITRILSKYHKAYEDSIKIYPDITTSQSPPMVVFPCDTTLKAQTLKIELPPGYSQSSHLMKILGENINHIQKNLKICEDRYRSGYVTLESFAKHTHMHILEAWDYLRQNESLGIRCCFGSDQESSQALKMLEKKLNPVIDLVTLTCIYDLKVAEEMMQTLGKLRVAQSTVDALHDLNFSYRAMRKGFMSVTQKGEQLFKQKITAQEVQNSIQYNESLLSWITSNCQIVPCKKALHLSKKKKNEMDSVLGQTFADTLLAAQEDQYFLFSDDGLLRTVAKNNFKIEGAWTQIVLRYCLQKGTLTREKYNRAIVSLIQSNYRCISMDIQVLIHVAKESNWMTTDKFLKVFSVLRPNISNTESALSLAVEFIYQVWFAPISPSSRNILLVTILQVLCPEKNPLPTLEKFRLSIHKKFALLPFQAREILSILNSLRQC